MAEEQQDPVMARIVEAVALAPAGDGDAARLTFAELCDERMMKVSDGLPIPGMDARTRPTGSSTDSAS